MSYLKKLVSQMVPPLYRTRAITSTRPSTSPRHMVSALLMRKYCNKAHPGPSRQLYHSHDRSFSPLICAFGLVSGGGIFRQLQMLHGTSHSDSFYKPPSTTEEQEFWNSIMGYLRKFVHLAHVVVHQLYHTRSIRPSRSLAICAFGLISGTIFRQVRKFHATVPSEKAYTTRITAVEPKFPIFCELRLSVQHNPTRVYVHGLWMCYYDENFGNLHHIINEFPTESDGERGKQDILKLDDSTWLDLTFKWPSFHGMDKDQNFWLKQFLKHGLTSVGVYRGNYFRDVAIISGPYVGGDKDIAKFLESNYRPGDEYETAQFQVELSKHVGASVKIIGSNRNPWHLQEIGILFTRDCKVLVDYPNASFAEGKKIRKIIVRLYEGKPV